MLYEVIAEREQPSDTEQNILCDQEIMLTETQAAKTGVAPYAMRRVVVYDEENDRTIELITNNFEWSTNTVSQLYKRRWNTELFFKALKQNLQVKTFTGTSPNAVKSQIYIALICYLLRTATQEHRQSRSYLLHRKNQHLLAALPLSKLCVQPNLPRC